MAGPENLSFILKGMNQLAFEDRPVPAIKNPTDVLIRVHFTGICGSDMHYWEHGGIGDMIVSDPMVLGHESSGIVLAIGPGCSLLKPGDHVALEPGVPCRLCHFCKSGTYNLCRAMQFASTPALDDKIPVCDGTLASYYVLPEDFCVKLPASVSLEEGALVEPLAVGVHACRLAEIKPRDRVVVFGAGPVGLLCAALVKAFGAEVVVVDIVQSRLEFAAAYAGAGVFNATHSKVPRENAEAIIKDFKLGYGADVAIDASGAMQSINTAIHVLRNGGRYVQVGMGAAEISFPIMAVCVKEITVKGSFRYGPGDYKLAVDLLASGSVSVKELITDRFEFEEAEFAFEAKKSGRGIKILIKGRQDDGTGVN